MQGHSICRPMCTCQYQGTATQGKKQQVCHQQSISQKEIFAQSELHRKLNFYICSSTGNTINTSAPSGQEQEDILSILYCDLPLQDPILAGPLTILATGSAHYKIKIQCSSITVGNVQPDLQGLTPLFFWGSLPWTCTAPYWKHWVLYSQGQAPTDHIKSNPSLNINFHQSKATHPSIPAVGIDLDHQSPDPYWIAWKSGARIQRVRELYLCTVTIRFQTRLRCFLSGKRLCKGKLLSIFFCQCSFTYRWHITNHGPKH